MSNNSKYELVHVTSNDEYYQYIRECGIKEIPAKYIERVVISFTDGSISEVPGEEINSPVPVNDDLLLPKQAYDTSCIDNVKVYVNMTRLSSEVKTILHNFLP